MKRRDLLAGAGSLLTLAGGGVVATQGVPRLGTVDEGSDAEADDDADGDGSTGGPREVRTVDAPGSEAGTVAVPGDGVTVLTFVTSSCGLCQQQVGRLAEARSRLHAAHGGEPTFLTVTYEDPDLLPEDRLAEWWTTHGGEGHVGYDPDPTLARNYAVFGYPATLVIDGEGTEHWNHNGVHDPRDMVRAVEAVLEDRPAAGGASEGTAENGTEPASETDEPASETDEPAD